MRIQVAGIDYSDFKSANVSTRMDAIASTFSFNATAKDGVPLPFKGGEPCKIFVDGEKVITGSIELVNVDGDSQSHNIQISGRDRTGDLVDSTIGALSELTTPTKLSRLIEIVLAHIGINPLPLDVNTALLVIDNFSPEPFDPAEDRMSAEAGDNAFEFLETFARKRQVLLSSNEDGNIVLANPKGTEIEATIINRIKDPDDLNNVIEYAVSYDLTGRYNRYIMFSQGNPVTANIAGIVESGTLVSSGSEIIDTLIRAGRQHVLTSESTSSGANQKNRTSWEANIRRARGKVYSVIVAGFRNSTNELWKRNTIVNVSDDYAGIKEKMLVNSVVYRQNLEDGNTTALGLIDKNAYLIDLAVEEPKIGEEFLLDEAELESIA